MSQNKIVIVTVLAMLSVAIGPAVVSMLSWPREGEYLGTVTWGIGVRDFKPAGSLEHWQVKDPTGVLQRVIDVDFLDHMEDWQAGDSYCFLMKVHGKLSPIGLYGAHGRLRRELTVERVVACEYVGSRPYEW